MNYDEKDEARRIRGRVRDCIGETIPLRRRWVSAIMAGPIAELLGRLSMAMLDNERLEEEIVRALKRADDENASADLYAKAWVRELGGLLPKAHHIDACVMTTRWLRERSDRLKLVEAEQRAAGMVSEYGPSNEMIQAQATIDKHAARVAQEAEQGEA